MTEKIEPVLISQELTKDDFNKVIWHTIHHNASDLMIDFDYPIRIDVKGVIHEITKIKLQPEACKQFLIFLLGSREALVSNCIASEPIYFSHIAKNPSDPTNIRSFRVAALTSRSMMYGKTFKMVCRLNPDVPENAEQLDIERDLVSIVQNSRKGIALFIGGTGTGKTTTMAGIIVSVLETKSNGKHIVIFEDPPEINYEKINKAKGNSVSVHEVGTLENDSDVLSFESGLKAALRLRPNILVQGEIRVKSGIIYALNFANTGHFLMATLHSNSCESAISRIYNMATGEDQQTVLEGFINSLSVLVAQLLVVTTDGERIAIREIVYLDDDLRIKLLNAKSNKEMSSAIRNYLEERGQTFKQQLEKLYQNGIIGPESLFLEVR
ncbi:ATPase, T2SS/T4P/T4SS family [Vibrio sp. RW]|uniref:ATPase, T2SS/T4P/T4SS family n=1 Tax=Vibrio sp. RW TaxID=2998833 RepID=UPI0022CD31A3|nr:ATPase, T2SS/T4P/T4SS family [Vibrio sp. RW]MDA0146190.1 ATPase, T2SS/T4P/T4SS family [Vibrio sp. RW]